MASKLEVGPLQAAQFERALPPGNMIDYKPLFPVENSTHTLRRDTNGLGDVLVSETTITTNIR